MSDNHSGIRCPHCDKGTLRHSYTLRAGDYTRVRRVKCDHCEAVCSVVAFVVDMPGTKKLATEIRKREARPVMAGRRVYPSLE